MEARDIWMVCMFFMVFVAGAVCMAFYDNHYIETLQKDVEKRDSLFIELAKHIND